MSLSFNVDHTNIVVLTLVWPLCVCRDPEAGVVRENGRGHRDHPAALPQPPGEEPRPSLHAQVRPQLRVNLSLPLRLT